MALQIIAGGSGSGKSDYIYKDIINKSRENNQMNYIIVVPEQYTMATQKRIVNMHPNKGIHNIDVVSFERLAYKVFEEVGGQNRPVLDDTGKNLIVRKVLGERKKELGYFGSNINKTGFVAEIKSVISELLQYDIDVEKLEKIRGQVDNRQLAAKLNDIGLVYEGFKNYLKDNYITSEEILDVLCRVIEKSKIISSSEIILDGFTGFTPIQYKLLNLLLIICENVYITVTIDAREKINVRDGMHNLFFMSREMYYRLMKLCDENHVKINDIIYLQDDINYRFKISGVNEELSFLEKNIFRYTGEVYEKNTENIKIYAASTAKDEINYVVGEIIRLTRFEGYHYRDIAIVTGDMASYGKLAGNICEQNNIPCFVDHKKSVTDNPAVELIRSALEMIEKNYSYDSVMRYLKTGIAGVSRENVDVIDNYCVAVGIRGAKAWHNAWTKRGRGRNAFLLEPLNMLREQIIAPFIALEQVLKDKESDVQTCVNALYNFIVELELSKNIDRLAMREDTGNEYDQLYKKIIELFDEMVELLGKERVGLKEFNRIIDAGFEEIKVGLIPPTSDCVVIGDIERTRLDNIRVLFFAGVNDGIIPKKSDNKGVLSETERDSLEKIDVTLSPSAREKAFVQKFYLYLLLTKASDKLYITYSTKSSEGAQLLPSYLIRNIRCSFPNITIVLPEDAACQKKYIKVPKSEIVWSRDNYIKALAQNMAIELYNGNIHGSVSAFETFSACKFAYFLKYGLGLEEKEEYSFEVNDFGTIMHSVLEQASKELRKNGQSLSTLEPEERTALVKECVENTAEDYKDTILKDNSRNEYMIKRITELADRTLSTIGNQLSSGLFTPDAYEINFLMDEQEVPLDGAKAVMSINGKIDRIDVCEDDENVYVRVIDYKTGKSDFDLIKTYYGLKMQLVTYMRAAMNIEAKRHPGKNIIPAGILYYNIDNPILEADNAGGGDTETMLMEALRMKGLVSDNKNIIDKMDSGLLGKSKVIPVTMKKDGSVDYGKSSVLNKEGFEIMDEYVAKKYTDIGKNILGGAIDVNPYESGSYNACTYCIYSAVCGFMQDLPGSKYRKLKKFSSETIFKNMREGVDEDGRKLD